MLLLFSAIQKDPGKPPLPAAQGDYQGIVHHLLHQHRQPGADLQLFRVSLLHAFARNSRRRRASVAAGVRLRDPRRPCLGRLPSPAAEAAAAAAGAALRIVTLAASMTSWLQAPPQQGGLVGALTSQCFPPGNVPQRNPETMGDIRILMEREGVLIPPPPPLLQLYQASYPLGTRFPVCPTLERFRSITLTPTGGVK